MLDQAMSTGMDNYIRGKVLGKGSFGSAILVTSKKDNRNYVIKEIDISRMPPAERESAKLEAQVREPARRGKMRPTLPCNLHTAWCTRQVVQVRA